MNQLQISEIKRRGLLKSKSEVNKNKNVYVLIKNGTSFGEITTNDQIVRIYVQRDNYSVYAIYNNGNSIPVYENPDLHRIMQ